MRMSNWRDLKWWIALAATLVLGVASITLALPHGKRLIISELSKARLNLGDSQELTITVNGQPVQISIPRYLPYTMVDPYRLQSPTLMVQSRCNSPNLL